MLSNREVEQYRELGYLVVPDVLDAPMLAEVRRMVDGIVADAGKVATHTEVYDLEDSHSSEQPRVRRIKTPHKHFPFFAELTRNRGSRPSWRNSSATTSACMAPNST
jgi:hypothetical protein